MSDDPDTLVDLTRTANELEAVSLIAELEVHGIPARMFGLGVMGYQAPALQPQRIMVRRRDLDNARLVLEEFDLQLPTEIDWSEVDTGDSTPPTEAEEKRIPQHFCASCGYVRDGLPSHAPCPECSAVPAGRHDVARSPGGSNFAVVGLVIVMGILLLLALLNALW